MKTAATAALAAIVACCQAFADDCPAPEGNLLNNPQFATDADGGMFDWNPNEDPVVAKCTSVADGALVFAPTNAAVSLRQRDILLAEGGKYRMGLWVKTRNFKPERCSAIVFNWAWTKEAGIPSGFPSDTDGKWVKLEREFTAPASRLGLFVFTVYVRGNQGELAIRNPWLVPVDDLAKSRSHRAPRLSDMAGGGKRLNRPKPARCTYRPEKRLNSLVVRLRSGTAKDGEVPFSVTRDGWIWISMEKGGRNTKAYLDGNEVIRFRDGERFETMRRVPSGDHMLRFEGVIGGKFVVNEIPQIFTYPYPQVFGRPGSWQQYGCRPFCGDFRRKYLYPCMNSFSYGYGRATIPKDDFADMMERGIELAQQHNWWNKSTKGFDGWLEPPEHLAKRLLASVGQTAPDGGGTTYDEIPMETVTEKWYYARAMRKLADAPYPHYTWSSGRMFTQNPLNAEYLAACIDAAKGHGRFLFECYPQPVESEAEAAEYLDKNLNEPVRRANRLVPDCTDGLMIIMGHYNCFGAISYNPFSSIDTKRFYDMFVRHLATDPEFTGLAGTGLYAYNHSKEEDVRWTARVFRHYLLEGRTELLSDVYGYAYRPDFLSNGDFADGLNGWKAESADKGAIEVRAVKSLGAKGMRISGPNSKVGDTAAVFKRSVKGASALSARIKGLKPGALYSLRYGVGSVKALEEKTPPPSRHLGIDADLLGVEMTTGRVPLGQYGLREYRNPCYNYRQEVFKALSEEAEIRFSDASADIGESLSVNAVVVAPYFPE